MTDEAVPLEGCPREGCDAPVLEAARTNEPFQLRRRNMVVDKWCIVPRVDPVDGEFWVYFIRHGEIEGFKTANEVAEAEAATTEAGRAGTTTDEGEDAGLVAPADLDGFGRAIVEHVKSEGTAPAAGIQGKMLDRDKAPSEVQAALEWLCEAGYLIEDEGSYRLPGHVDPA